MTPQKKILEQLLISEKKSLKIQVRTLKSQITILKKNKNVNYCEYNFVCDKKQKKINRICNRCFEDIRKRVLGKEEMIVPDNKEIFDDIKEKSYNMKLIEIIKDDDIVIARCDFDKLKIKHGVKDANKPL